MAQKVRIKIHKRIRQKRNKNCPTCHGTGKVAK